MKKTIIMVIVMMAAVIIYAEPVISSYQSSGKTYSVELDSGDTRYVEVMETESDATTPFMILEAKDVPHVIRYLKALKSKHIEWSKVAKENDIQKYTKIMALEEAVPNVHIMWKYGRKWHRSKYTSPLLAVFVVVDGTSASVLGVSNLVSADNMYIDFTQKSIILFVSVDEIDSLIDALDDKHILAHKAKINRDENLFK